jgi:CheY-specific phosphatase CheX
MMNKEDRTLLRDVCFSVFEQLAFMFGDELEDDEIDCPADTFFRATMGFKGAEQGTVAIVVPEAICTTLAANILGLDDDQDVYPDTAVDALKELLNTITGRLMTELFTEDTVNDLTIPVTEQLNHADWESLVESDAYIAIDIDEHPVLITIQRQQRQ